MAEQEAAVSENETDGIAEMQANVEQLKTTEDIVEEASEETLEEGEGEQYNATELKAMEKGWSPDKDNLPEGKEWIGAGEFLRNERLYSEIHKLKREVRARGREFEVLKEHHKKVADTEREKLLAQLKHQKKQALEDDDHEAVVEIDEQIMDVKAAANAPDEVEAQNVDNTAFLEWVENNQWYETDDGMRQTAEEIGAAYVTQTQGKASPQQLFKYVEDRIKQLYPQKFEPTKPAQAKRKAAPAVEAGGNNRVKQRAGAKKYTVKDLNEDQLKVMKTFEKSGVLKPQEYIDELVRIGELG